MTGIVWLIIGSGSALAACAWLTILAFCQNRIFLRGISVEERWILESQDPEWLASAEIWASEAGFDNVHDYYISNGGEI